jgi:hypothetical protein
MTNGNKRMKTTLNGFVVNETTIKEGDKLTIEIGDKN